MSAPYFAVEGTPAGLKERLLRPSRTRWLDVGCGGNFEGGFEYLDIFSPELVDPVDRRRYHCIDIANAPEDELRRLGLYDFVRMQHVLEHFTFEQAPEVLRRCGRLLEEGGWLLVTTPDLRINPQKYLSGQYKTWNTYQQWATQRIPHDAPESCYFSIFAHSMPGEEHKWCYDYEGLAYQVQRAGEFEGVKEFKYGEPLSSYPYTHNRPEEDVCAIAQKKRPEVRPAGPGRPSVR